MARFERDNSGSTALSIITARIKNSAVYCNVYNATVEAAAARCIEALRSKSTGLEEVEAMKALGGFSQVIGEELEKQLAATPEAQVSQGSTMLPITPAIVLRHYIPGEMRSKVQTKVSAALSR